MNEIKGHAEALKGAALPDSGAFHHSAGLIGDPLGWAADNILHPAVNVALLEPYNTVAHLADSASQHLGGFNLLPEAKLLSVPKANFLSGGWFAQSIAGGLGMLVP